MNNIPPIPNGPPPEKTCRCEKRRCEECELWKCDCEIHECPNKIILIVAGRYEEFVRFSHEIGYMSGSILFHTTKRKFYDGLTEYIYCSEPHDLRGFHGVEVRFIGTAYRRKDLEEFKWLAKCAEQK